MATNTLKSVARYGLPPAEERAFELENKLVQLRSLLTSMYGSGAEGFESIGPGHRDNLVWLAADLADQACRLSGYQD